jgi:L-ascorbate metabolism protein UlaG (beta-lactamase superfamily)
VTSGERTAGQITATFLGNTTLLISDGETSLMTDGFFTRPGLGKLLFGKLEPDTDKIRNALQKLDVANLSAVIPVHSHHDHAMDAPEVAKQTEAKLVGSRSTANIGRGWGLAEGQIITPAVGEKIRFGKFSVTLLLARHLPVPDILAKMTGIGEEIEEPLIQPARLWDYKEGGSFALLIEHPAGNLLINGSAGFVKGLLHNIDADVVFLGIAGLGKQTQEYKEAYFFEVVKAVGAKTVIPIHWDDFTESYSEGLQPAPALLDSFNANMDYVVQEVEKDPDLNLIILPMWGKAAFF